jgi:hypothetical protein
MNFSFGERITMGLPTKIIALETLMKRWRMSLDDIFLIFLNQDLRPVYFEDTSWKYFGEDGYHDPIELFIGDRKGRPIIFLRSDVERLEQEQGGSVIVSPDVISKETILKRWDISGIELGDLLEGIGLDVVDPLGVKIEDFDNLMDRHLISYPNFDPHKFSWYLRLSDIEQIEKEHGISPASPIPKKSKLRPSQIHKKRCIQIAQQLWKKDPTITIADMALRDEINKACDGEVYAEKTIREWVKKECPNRNPGRRPKKKQ